MALPDAAPHTPWIVSIGHGCKASYVLSAGNTNEKFALDADIAAVPNLKNNLFGELLWIISPFLLALATDKITEVADELITVPEISVAKN